MKDPLFASGDPEHEVSGEDKARCRNDIDKLRQMGLAPYLVRVHTDGTPTQYFFNFPRNEPSYLYRKKLGDNGFEVRQEMGDKMLAFYVCKPDKKKASWD